MEEASAYLLSHPILAGVIFILIGLVFGYILITLLCEIFMDVGSVMHIILIQ